MKITFVETRNNPTDFRYSDCLTRFLYTINVTIEKPVVFNLVNRNYSNCKEARTDKIRMRTANTLVFSNLATYNLQIFTF